MMWYTFSIIFDILQALSILFLIGLGFIEFLNIIDDSKKPPKHFHRTLITLEDFNECIRLFVYENTIFTVESGYPGNIWIHLHNQNIFAFGFMRRVALLKAEVARNLPVGLKVHWSVFK